MKLTESEALKLWLSLEEASNEKLRFLAKTDGDEEAAKWAFIRAYSKKDVVPETIAEEPQKYLICLQTCRRRTADRQRW